MLAATVRAHGSGTPTGPVRFWAGENLLGEGQLDPAGRAQAITTSLPAGHHVVVAVYPGEEFFPARSATGYLDVDPRPTTREITKERP